MLVYCTCAVRIREDVLLIWGPSGVRKDRGKGAGRLLSSLHVRPTAHGPNAIWHTWISQNAHA